MNILDSNSDFSFNEEIDAEYVTNKGLSAIWDLCIQPMKSKLSQEDLALIGVVCMTLKIVAQKATAYEKMQQGKPTDSKENEFYRN